MIDADVSRRKFEREIERLDGPAAPFVAAAKWDVVGRSYPLFEVVWTHPRSGRRVGFRFRFDDWNEHPPSLELFDPASLASLAWAMWPRNVWSVGETHPKTNKPFLCLRGIREYHEHPSHLADTWDVLRELSTYAMLDLMQRVQKRFEDSDG